MLDDASADNLCQSYVAGVGVDFFVHSHSIKQSPNRKMLNSVCFDLNTIQEVVRHASVWKLVFLSRSKEDDYVYERLQNFSLRFVSSLAVSEMDLNEIRSDFHACDVVFAPKFCEQYNWRHKFRSPISARGMLSVLIYFSITMVPFSQESYYQALQTYDNP